ncbi:MAG: hypothetical protein K9J79_03730 [Desulfobacteraceae bacterium]|nr:hypothetical protein [Desulfobacteraceae bacterium]
MAEETPQVFKSKNAVIKWLQANDYKVSKSKVYNDAREGLLKVERDGSVTIESVRRYIDHPEAGIREHLDTVQAGDDLEIKEYHRRAAIAKAKKTELEAQRLQFEMDKDAGKWIAREDLEMEMAARAAVLDQGIRNLVRIRAEDWIHMVGGDTARAGELKAAVNDALDQLMNAYVKTDSFQVMFEGEE